jgi:hypothetical protein
MAAEAEAESHDAEESEGDGSSDGNLRIGDLRGEEMGP